VLLIPRWLNAGRVTFKYGLGNQFINVLKVIELLGLDSTEKIEVKGVQVAPRDVVAAALPDPAHLGDRMHGKTCAGTWVRGEKDGKPREVYLYQVADNQECMRRCGVQAVVWQTAVNPVIAMELSTTARGRARASSAPRRSTRIPSSPRCRSSTSPWAPGR
jgi:saccharopine dehydrogenase-like NADP-dependent oxidoreductase